MTTIYFVRHGEYKNSHIIPGRTKGYPLSQKGIKQIKGIINYFQDKKIQMIFSSPMLRTKQSAKIIADKLNLSIKISNAVNEVDTPFKECEKNYLFSRIKNIYYHPYHLKNRGETIEEIYQRVKNFVIKILKNYKNKNIIIVSHGDPIMIYLDKRHFTGDLLEHIVVGNYEYIPKAGIIEIKFKEGKLISTSPLNY